MEVIRKNWSYDSYGNIIGTHGPTGNTFPGSWKKSAKSCLWLGDSLTRLGVRDRHPLIDDNRSYYILSPSYTNINSAGTFIKTTSVHPSCPTGNGTLTYDKTNLTLTWTANGDTAGTPVVVGVGGHLKIESGSANATLYISCIPAAAPVGSGTISDTISVTGTRVYTNADLQGFTGWANILLGFPFIYGDYNYGIGGCSAFNQWQWQEQWKNIYTDLSVINLGTNSSGTLAAAATELGYLEQVVRLRQGIGSTVILCTLFPKNSLTTAAYQAWQQFNVSVRALAATLNVDLCDAVPYLGGVGNSTGFFSADMTNDGTHLTGKGGYIAAARALVPVMRKYVQPFDVTLPSGILYDATNAPQGNLLTNGVLTGSAGTKGSPISGAVATSMTASAGGLGVGTSIVATEPDNASPILRGDGLRGGYQRLVIDNTGGAADKLCKLVQAANITTNFTAGTDYIQYEGDIRVSGTLLKYLTVSADLSNGSMQAFSCSQPIHDLDGDSVSLHFRTKPMLIETGATTLNINNQLTTQANGIGILDNGQNLVLHKATP